MTDWLFFALDSAFFAGLTAILAKIGVERIPATLATLIRTVVILGFVALLVSARREWPQPGQLNMGSLTFLILSGLTTGLSWLESIPLPPVPCAGPSCEQGKARPPRRSREAGRGEGYRSRRSATATTSNAAMRRGSAQPSDKPWVAAAGRHLRRHSSSTYLESGTPSSSFLGAGDLASATQGMRDKGMNSMLLSGAAIGYGIAGGVAGQARSLGGHWFLGRGPWRASHCAAVGGTSCMTLGALMLALK